MISTNIQYQQTGYFSNLITDYLSQRECLRTFYNESLDLESFEKLILERSRKQPNRTILVSALEKQYEGVEVTTATQNNIQSLINNNCFTVTTGHQLSLFSGPLYFIYKIISVINLTKQLKEAYPEQDFIPVFWMATEDHDFDEVNHFNLFGHKIELQKNQNGAVGRMILNDDIENITKQLREVLGGRPQTEEILGLFSKFYRAEKSLTQATREFVNHLFGKYGLVIIDGDDFALKKEMINEFKNELIQQGNYKIINQTTKKLVDLGYKAQISPREINLFYLCENIRERIVFEENRFKVLNTDISFSLDEIIYEIEQHPHCFSPNVALRPLYQEKILPNLAYVGGGGELAYWFQLKEMFNQNQISYPILVLRNSVLFVDASSKKKLDKIGVSIPQLFEETDVLIKKVIQNGSDIILDLKKEEKDVTLIFEEMVEKASKIDATLKPMVNAELQKVLKIIQNIESKLIKAERQKEEVVVNQIKNIKEKLFPNGSLQERHDNITSLFLLVGFDVVDELVQALNPLNKEFTIIEL